jgi:hypothetical protein
VKFRRKGQPPEAVPAPARAWDREPDKDHSHNRARRAQPGKGQFEATVAVIFKNGNPPCTNCHANTNAGDGPDFLGSDANNPAAMYTTLVMSTYLGRPHLVEAHGPNKTAPPLSNPSRGIYKTWKDQHFPNR